MTGETRLGYIAVETRRADRWLEFNRNILGLPEPVANGDGSLGFQVDEAQQRLILVPGRGDDLHALGFELPDEQALVRLERRLADLGVATERGDEALARARRVGRLLRFADPAGNRLEAFADPEPAAAPLRSDFFPRGFVTGALGLGHAVLITRDPDALERFYADALGFAVTERLTTQAGPIKVRGTFMHCNRRHHSLALFDLPLRKRLHHFMLQARNIADVGLALQRIEQAGVPLSLGLGQHPQPDGTVSFYAATPSGFDIEIGTGAGEIDPPHWHEMATSTTSAWGHKPTLRLQLRLAGRVVADRLGL